MSKAPKTTSRLPKLPPMPRKGNRTIYLANDELWETAKRLAGSEGLSAVIARSLAEFVAQRTSSDEDFETFHFETREEAPVEGSGWGPEDVIGFEGKLLLQRSFVLLASPFHPSHGPADKGGEADISIYRTRLGNFVVLASPTSEDPREDDGVVCEYERHKSLRDLMGGEIVSCFAPADRYELLQELTAKLGKDAVTWID